MLVLVSDKFQTRSSVVVFTSKLCVSEQNCLLTRVILKLFSVMFGQVGCVDDVLNSIVQQKD